MILGFFALINLGHNISTCVQQTWFTDMFDVRIRYSGAGFAYAVAGAVGGFMPLIATALMATAATGSLWPSSSPGVPGGPSVRPVVVQVDRAGPAMTDTLSCDLLVIGAGAGGLSAAVTAAYHGRKSSSLKRPTSAAGRHPGRADGSGPRATPSPAPTASTRTSCCRAPTCVTARDELPRRKGRCIPDAAAHGRVLPRQNQPPVRSRSQHRRHLRRHPRRRNRTPLGGTPTHRRLQDPAPVRAKMRWQLYETSFLGMGIMAGPDLQAFLHATRSPKAFGHAARRVTRHLLDLATARKGMQLVNGTALIGRLLASADELGVDIRVSSPARTLTTDDSGAVTGAQSTAPTARSPSTPPGA